MFNESDFFCKTCNVKCRYKSDYERHLSTAKHRRGNFSDVSTSKTLDEYTCEKCNYTCSKLSLWKKHVNTKKHLGNFSDVSSRNVSLPDEKYECKFCTKTYGNYSSFWSHQKLCSEKSRDTISDTIIPKSKDTDYVSLISSLIDENKELRNFVIEQSKDTKQLLDKVIDMKPQQTINNTMNNNNKFNVNVFLHEQCKNALNLSEFINRIEVSQEDLENNAQLGFVNGISKIFLDNLKQLSIYERPIHCTDVKREIMYIRDEDTWNKEDNNKKLSSAIQEVSWKSMQSLNDWKGTNPEYDDMDSDFTNKCIVIHQTSNAGANRDIYYPKVIKTLAREIAIDKGDPK